MTNYLLAVCTSGHLIDSAESDEVAVKQMDVQSSISMTDVVHPEYEVKYNYCPDCGGKVLTECPQCGANLQAEYGGPPFPNEEHVPDFCHGCGEAFPWVETVEAEKQREGDFIQIDDADIDGHFYPSLVYEINLCYKVKADHAVLVLNRKLMESLIADILRTVFTMDRLELFYDEGSNQMLPLSKLIDSMKSNRSELQKYASIDERFFRVVEDLKYRGDASAHSIEEDFSRIDLAEKSEQATFVAKILFRLRSEAKTAHRNH